MPSTRGQDLAHNGVFSASKVNTVVTPALRALNTKLHCVPGTFLSVSQCQSGLGISHRARRVQARPSLSFQPGNNSAQTRVSRLNQPVKFGRLPGKRKTHTESFLSFL